MRAIILAGLVCAAASQAHAGACLLKRESPPSGFLKTCWYDCALGEVAVTVRATRLCKLMIEHGGRDRVQP
jgi:hypothetical protein